MEDNKQLELEGVEVIEDQTLSGDEHHHHHHSEHSHHHHHHHHHSGHSHHHKHHRRHRRRRHNRNNSSKKKPNKLVAFFKKHRSILINILSCTISVVLLVVMAFNIDDSRSNQADGAYTNVTKSTVQIETSVYSDKILLVSDAISYYMNPDNDASANEVYKSFDGYKQRLNMGMPLNFAYRVTGLPSDVEAQSAVLEISEHEDYRDALSYTLDLDVSSLDIYNLKTGTSYYYRVNLTLDNGSVIGTTGAFETVKSPRILNIDGTVNARDIGGWTTTDGRVVKQGLLYRGSEIDGEVQPDYKITDRGLQQMIGDLGVRFDMDLRSASENKSGVDALGKNVVHKYYGVGMYSAILDNKEQVREIFSDLANPDNYPIYLHCTYGRDRTGSVCYLLEALLGVSDSDLRKDYDISAFTDSYVNTAEFNAFVEKINTFSGDTTQKKVEGYLLSIGVTSEEIATIRQIFLEE